jgi:hypothetical protein
MERRRFAADKVQRMEIENGKTAGVRLDRDVNRNNGRNRYL